MLKFRSRSEVSLAGMGFDLAASVGVGVALGWWIDHRFGTDPWGVLVCSTVGIIGGLLNFVRGARIAARRAERRADEQADAADD